MQIINLQITPSGVLPVVNASQFDRGRLVQFNLYDGASAYTIPTGTEIRIEGRKSDNNGFSYSCPWLGNAVTMTLTQQMTALAEDVQCELRLTLGGTDIGTINFILKVEQSNIQYTVISETEIPAIIALAQQQEEDSEAWAVGTRNGIPVTSDDPTYHNNSKYYAENVQVSLENLDDADITTPSDGQIIVYDGTTQKWKNITNALSALADVALLNPANGQVLKYNSATSKWENANESGGGGSSSLSGLSDVNLVSLAANQFLRYNGTDQKWENYTLPTDTVLTDTLTIGATTLTFTDASIGNNSLISIYTDPYGVVPTAAVQSGTTVTLTFEAQSAAVDVAIVVKN